MTEMQWSQDGTLWHVVFKFRSFRVLCYYTSYYLLILWYLLLRNEENMVDTGKFKFSP